MIKIYTKDHCPYCDSAKQYLDSHNIPYEAVRVDLDPDAYAWLVEQGHRSVPQLYNDGELLVEGGYQGLIEMPLDKLNETIGE